jgi:hypothetical protein
MKIMFAKAVRQMHTGVDVALKHMVANRENVNKNVIK